MTDTRKLVYVAGPYAELSDSTVNQNIARTDKAARKLYLDGFDVICPNNNTAHWDDDADIMAYGYPSRILDMDLNILSRCDAIFMCKGWTESAGSRLERHKAIELGLGVWYE